MDLLVELLLPLFIYVVFSLFDGLQTLSTLRPPGTLNNAPLQNEIFKFENNLDFARKGINLGMALGRDTGLSDWHWPISGWKWNFDVDKDFQVEYDDNKMTWWFVKVIGIILLSVIFSIFTWLSKYIFKGPQGKVTFTLTTAVGLVLVIIFSQYVARIFFRLSVFLAIRFVYMMGNMIKFLTKSGSDIKKQLSDMINNLPDIPDIPDIPDTSEFSSSENLKKSGGGMLEFLLYSIVDKFNNDLKNSENANHPQFDIKRMEDIISTPLTKILSDDWKKNLPDMVIDKFEAFFLEVLVDKCKFWMIPTNGKKEDGIAYNLKDFPTSSIARFLLFDNKGLQALVFMMIVSYIVAGAFSMGGRITRTTIPLSIEDKMLQQKSGEKSALPLVTKLGLVCVIACVYLFVYGMLLVCLRQLALKILYMIGHSKKGTDGNVIKSVWSAICNELIEYSHVFKLPDEVKFLKGVKELALNVLLFSAFVPLVAFILITIYIIINDDPEVENYKDAIKIIHYVESAKAIGIIVSVVGVAYFALNAIT